MIHHVSIPARDPERVARVLAELLGGYSGPFIGPFPGAFVAYAEDAHGTGIEVYPDTTLIVPGDGEATADAALAAAPHAGAFHALLSVAVDRARVEAIGAREGWRTLHAWRGPPGVKLFELVELWVENRVLFEVTTSDMDVAKYVAIANGQAQRALLERARQARVTP